MTLNEIAELRDDWDGMGAVAPTSEVVEAARRFKQPDWVQRITAGPNGSIVFDNGGVGGLYREAEIDKPGWVDYMEETEPKKYRHWTEPV